MTRSARAVLILIVAAAAGCASAPPTDRPRDLLEGLERRVLPNGLAVVVKEDRRLPFVTAMVAYRVGSVNEPPGLTGVSHFFEHMVFKGTEKYKRGDIDLVTYRCAGENNAFTTHDMTGYWFHVASRHLDRVLDILADTMGNCTLEPIEFTLERGPVLQEMSLWLDGPWGELERALEKTVYETSRYRHPVLGWREDVESLTRDRMMEYYKAWYRTNNASLVIVGDVDREEAFRKAEAFFGGKAPTGKDAPDVAWREPAQPAERQVAVDTALPADRFIMAFRTDAAGTDTDIVLDVISTILAHGRNSRLKARLVEREDLAGEDLIEATNYSRRYEGMFYVQVEVALGGSPEKARRAVAEELQSLGAGPVRDRELRRAKNVLRAEFAFDAESQVELTSKIGYFEALGLPEYVRTYMDRVEAVTPEQVQACARRVFREANRTTAIGKAKAKRSPDGVRSPRRKAWVAEPRRRGTEGRGGGGGVGEVRRVVLENGLRVLATRRSDVPVLSVQVAVAAGSLFDSEAKAGLAELTGDLLDEGTEDDRGRRRSADGIASEVEFVGGRYSTGAGGAAAKVLSEHASTAFDLVRDVIRYPSFPPDRFDRAREDQLAEIESQDDDPSGTAHRLFAAAAYPGHPYGRPEIGLKETVEKLTWEDVEAFHRRLYRPENAIVSVAGDIDPDRAIEEVRARFGTWKGDGPWVPPSLPEPKRPTGPTTVNHTFDSEQARIMLGHSGIARKDPDFAVLRVLETILMQTPGFTNRLAKAVRDTRGLAYDVSGTVTGGAGLVAGPFQIVLGVQAKDKDAGLKVVMDELRAFREQGPTAEETEDAKRYLVESYASRWETLDGVAGWLIEVERYGLGLDDPDRFRAAVLRTTADDVLRAARKHLRPEELSTVVVGPVDGQGKPLQGERKR